jgi:mono/diheme cytochrome c family protein
LRPLFFLVYELELRAVRLPSLFFVFACAVALPFGASAADRFDLPKGPGRDLVYGYCQTCHDLQSVEDSAGIPHGAWNAVLDNMKGFGLRVSDEQRAKILDYLGTWLGPNPPAPESADATVASAKADGAAVFENTCIACHQEGGKGKPGEFPPLAGNHDLFLSADFPAYVVLNGIEGKLQVNGEAFDNAMPPFDFLSDEEIAAVIAYVRSSWGNASNRPDGMKDIGASDVHDLRAKTMESAEVLALRQSLLP